MKGGQGGGEGAYLLKVLVHGGGAHHSITGRHPEGWRGHQLLGGGRHGLTVAHLLAVVLGWSTVTSNKREKEVYKKIFLLMYQYHKQEQLGHSNILYICVHVSYRFNSDFQVKCFARFGQRTDLWIISTQNTKYNTATVVWANKDYDMIAFPFLFYTKCKCLNADVTNVSTNAGLHNIIKW